MKGIRILLLERLLLLEGSIREKVFSFGCKFMFLKRIGVFVLVGNLLI